jgi:thiamine biosynthesis lipoprotein
MGTRFELALEAGVDGNLRVAGEAAIDEIEEWHRRLSRFTPDSLLSHINRTAAARAVRLDRETFALFDDALAVWRSSDGAFDIGIAPLMAAYGYAPSSVPGGSATAGSAAIELDAEAWTIRFARPGVSLDLGAIAKGHALDCAAALLREHGVTRALLHGGTSSVLAIGAPEWSEGWRVALGPGAGARVIALRDASLAVSDPSSQAGVMRPGHILDPRSRAPVVRAGIVAVIGPSARLADAWTTALVVLGHVPEGFPAGYRVIFGRGSVV